MFVSDLPLTLRSLGRRRGFAAAVVSTLGLALGASGVVAAAADRALLRPLPFDDASRVAMLWEAGRGDARRLAAYPTFLDWQRDAHRVSLGYARGNQTIWHTAEGTERLTAAYVSPGYLRVLGAHLSLGRAFTPDEERPGRAENVAIISDVLWRRAFGGDVAAVGRSMELDGRAITVIGVLPPGESYPMWAEVWRPIAAVVDRDPALASRHHHSDSRVIARPDPGVDLASALTELATIERRLAATYPEHGAEWTGMDSKPLTYEIVGESTGPVRLLAGAVALVLLVASANVATLLLLRAMERDRELSVRAALGATRARLMWLVSFESAVLGIGATVLGLALTALGLRVLREAAPASLPRASELALDGRSVSMILTLAVIATTLTAVGPLLHAARLGDRRRGGRGAMGMFDALRSGRGSTGGTLGGRIRGALTVVQLALALSLLAGAGLLLESFRRLRAVDLGFDPAGVTVFWVSPPHGRYDSAPEAAALYDRLMAAVAALPGVEHVALANHVPLSGGWIPTNVVVPGRAPAADGEDQALYKTVSTEYLAVMRTPLRRGRWFRAEDERGAGATGAVVINEAMARRYWPGTDPSASR